MIVWPEGYRVKMLDEGGDEPSFAWWHVDTGVMKSGYRSESDACAGAWMETARDEAGWAPLERTKR